MRRTTISTRTDTLFPYTTLLRSLRLHLVAEQEFQDRRALLLDHALEMRGVGEVHVERLAARLGVGAHRRVPRAELVALEAGGPALHRLAARLIHGPLARAVHCGERVETDGQRRGQAHTSRGRVVGTHRRGEGGERV